MNLQPEWNRLCLGGLFCRISHRQQLSQHKKSFSGMLVVPAGLSLGSLNKRCRTNYQKKENTEGKQKKKKKQCVKQSSHLDMFTQTEHIRRHRLIKNGGTYSNVHPYIGNRAVTNTSVPLGIVICFLIKKNFIGAKVILQYVSQSAKQLKRRTRQHLGRSTQPWLWWDKMSTPQDTLCCLALPTAHCSYLSPTVTLVLPGV